MRGRFLLLLFVIFVSFVTATTETQGRKAQLKFGLYYLSGGPLSEIVGDSPCRVYWGKIMIYRGPIGIGTAYIGESGRHNYTAGEFHVNETAYDWTVWKRDAFSYLPIIIECIPYSKRLGYGDIRIGISFTGSLWAKGRYSSAQNVHPYRGTLHYCIVSYASSYSDVGISLSYNPLSFITPLRFGVVVAPELRLGISKMKYPLPTVPDPYRDRIPTDKLSTTTSFYVSLDVSLGIRVYK